MEPASMIAQDPVSLSAPPREGQQVQHNGGLFTTIREGEAFILIPPNVKLSVDPTSAKQNEEKQSVFYNPIQQYNRDLTVVAIRAFGQDYVASNEQKCKKVWEKLQSKKQNKTEAKEDAGSKRKATDDIQENGHKRARIDGQTVSKNNENGLDHLENSDPYAEIGLEYEDIVMAEQALGINQSTTDSITKQSSVGNERMDNEPQKLNESNPFVPFKILDALSATGLRALRYAKEIPFVTSITANDLSATAVQAIKDNIEHNQLPRPNIIKATTGNATSHMAYYAPSDRPGSFTKKYTVVDLDPYGTAVPFLDSAVQATANGGLLCVTCTDTALLNSMGYLEKTYSQYGGLPMKGHLCYEGGLRLMLNSIATAAAKHGVAIEPLLSLSIDYYARVFVRLRRSAAEVKLLAGKTMIVYSCDHGCGAYKTQFFARNVMKEGKEGNILSKVSAAQGPSTTPTCEHCQSKMHIAGPMYGGPIHNPSFIRRILEMLPELDPKVYGTLSRLRGMLTTALEETELYPSFNDYEMKKEERLDEAPRFARVPPAVIDSHPFFFLPSDLGKILHVAAPSQNAFKGALRYLGYKAERAHPYAGSIKTDAPWSAIWEIMREFVRQKCNGKVGKLLPSHAGWRIMNQSTGPVAENPDWEKVLADKQQELRVEQVDGEWRVYKRKKGDNAESKADIAPSREIVFDEGLGKKERYPGDFVRYQVNPRENWGPMSKAKVLPKETAP
jgi:tRNA (guanine26-N2/guanine27-N2)-dimethyltransferase